MQKKLNLENKESLKKLNDISSIYYLFDQIIQEIMPQVPEFRGFFKILNMITFAFHYNISLHSIGKTIKTCNAFHYNKKYVEYVPQIPEVFPPLPVSNRKEILIEIKFNEIMNHLNKTKFLKEINKILHDEQDDFTKDCLNEMNEKIKSFYRSKAFSLLEDKDLHNDDFIHLNKMTDVIIEYMKNATNFVKFGFYQLLTKMENFLKKENIYVRNCSDNMSFSQLKAQCIKYMKIITELIANKKRESEDRILQLQMTLDQNINYENIFKRKPLTHQNSNQLQQIRQTINDLNYEINETKKANSEKNVKFFLFRGILEQNLKNLSDALEDFESKYQNAISPIPLIQKLYIVKPAIEKQGKINKIIGGCKVRFSNETYIKNIQKSKQEIKEIHSSKSFFFRNKEFIKCSSGLSGLLIKLEIISIPFDGLNNMFSQYIEINDNKKEKELSKISIDQGINEMIKYQNEKEMNNQETPAYFACCSGDITSIKILIDNGADFGKTLQNGISPFLAAIMNGHHDVVKLLLKDSNAKIGDINQTTETGITPLSWAVYYNFPDIVALLLMKGADITHPLKSNGMTSVHLACFHNRFECLSILAHSTNEDIYEKSEIGDTPLHIALEHSLKCAYFLIDRMKDTNFHLKNSHNNTVRDIAIMSGHYDLIHKLPNDGMFNQKSENKNKIDEICHAFASGCVSIAEKVFYRFINQLNLTENQKNELIEYACIGGCTKFVEILSKVIDFKQFPIALFVVKYGLIDWISEMEKFGGDLMTEIDNKTIFDEAVGNSDYNFLFNAFNAVDSIPPNVIKRMIYKSIENNDVNTIIIISNALSEKKFCKFLDHSDVFISSLTSISFSVFKNNLDPKVEIKLSDHIQNISLKMVEVLLSNFDFQKEDLKLAITKAIESNRNDIAFVILEKNMNIAKEIKDKSKINALTNNNKLKAITKINLLIHDEIMPENEKIKELNNIFCSIFDLGNLPFEDNLSLAIYAGKKIKNLWILKALPKYCLEKFYLLTISIKYNNLKLLFQKLIQIFEQLYGRKKTGMHFLNSFRLLDFEEIEKSGKADEFVTELIEITKDQYITEVDDNNQTVFHLVSKFSSLNDENINLIFETINNLDLEYLIKYRTKKGKTILMEFANSGIYKAIEYFTNKNLYSFYNRDTYGDNILHAILNGRNASNNKMFSCFCNIIKKCPELILQKNRDNESPFMIAAKKGFNGILALMTTIYPIKVLDSVKTPILHIAAQNNYPETIRYIVQHLHVNVNIRSEDGLTPLHIAAMTSSIHAYEELISLGGNPLITCREMTAIDYALEHGSEKMIEYVMKQPSFKYELSTPKVIFHLAKNPEGYSSFVLALAFYLI